MSDNIQSGDQVPVIQCKNPECRHIARLLALPADDEGLPYAQFQHRCPKCGEDQAVLLSEVKSAKAHRKQ